MIRRSALLLTEIVAGLIAGLAIIVALLAWRLSIDEPLQLRFLTPYLEQALNPPDGRFVVHIGATVLAWRGWQHALELDARDVQVVDRRGARVATVPEVAVALSADGRLALSVSWDNTINLWDVSSGRVLASFTGEGAFVSLAISSDGRRVIAGDALGRIHLFEVRL